MTENNKTGTSTGTGPKPPPKPAPTTPGPGGKKDNKKKDRRRDRGKPAAAASPAFTGSMTDSVMEGVVITVGARKGHMSLFSQFRNLQEKLAIYADHKVMYKVPGYIVSLAIPSQSDFLTPMPDPLLYSKVVEVDGNQVMKITDAVKQHELNTV